MNNDFSNLLISLLNKKSSKLSQLTFIYDEIAKRMSERLDYTKLQPRTILDIGSGLNIDANLLLNRYPKSQLFKIDIALSILKAHNKPPTSKLKNLLNLFSKTNQYAICANATSLPIKSHSIDLAWSNLVLPYIQTDNIKKYFGEIKRVLSNNATFFVAGFGVDSLKELRELGLQTYNFPDMHLIGDMLLSLGFTNPVTDVEYIKLEYDNPWEAIHDIRLIGCGAITPSPNPNKLTRECYHSLKSYFNSTTPNSKFTVTLEIFYAHAWNELKKGIPIKAV